MKTLCMLVVGTMIGISSGLVQADEPGPREQWQSMMKKFDKNGNGRIDEDERGAIREAMQARGEEMRKQFMEKYDTNKDGKIGDDEKEAIRKAWSQRSEEGRQKWEEMRKKAGEQHAQRRKEFMEKYDTDKDGKLGDDERKAMMESWKKQGSARMAEIRKKMEVARKARSDDEASPSDQKVAEKPDAKKECPAKKCPKASSCPKKGTCPKAASCPKAGSCPQAKKCPKDGDGPKAEKCPKESSRPSEARRPSGSRGGHPHHGHHGHRREGHRHPGHGDRDGGRSGDRSERGESPGQHLVERIMNLDKNDDGKLNADEFPAPLRQYFGRIDTDNDGYVSRGELAKSADRLHAVLQGQQKRGR